MSDETIKIVTYANLGQEPQPPAADGKKIGVDIAEHWWDAQVQSQNSTPPKDDKQAGGLSVHDVSINKLEKELVSFIKKVDEMFAHADAEAQTKFVELAEVELSVAIDHEGTISVMGIGGKLGDTKTVTLKFKRKTQS